MSRRTSLWQNTRNILSSLIGMPGMESSNLISQRKRNAKNTLSMGGLSHLLAVLSGGGFPLSQL